MPSENPLFNKEKRSAQSSKDVRVEDALKHLMDCEESEMTASVDSLAGGLGIGGAEAGEVLGELSARGLVTPQGDGWQLKESGRRFALEMVRRHRLYETYLARKMGVPAEEWHRKADVEEHALDRNTTDDLADILGNPRYDPHGDPIPTRDGELPPVPGKRISLGEWDLSKSAMIVHVEDEPITMYRKLVSLGIHAEMVLSRMEKLSNGAVLALVEGKKMEIAPEFLGLIHVGAVALGEDEKEEVRRLSDLEIGEEGIIHGLSAACYGPERRRLLDLGVVPGTKIRCEFTSPFGSPRSYLIRGTLFGFRTEQADKILLEPQG